MNLLSEHASNDLRKFFMAIFRRSNKGIRFSRMCVRVFQDSDNHPGLIFSRDGSVAASAEWYKPGALTDHGGPVEHPLRKECRSDVADGHPGPFKHALR